MQPVFQHRKTLENGQQVVLDWFTYQVPVFSNLAVNVGAATNQFTIQSDADFEWVMSTYEFDVAAAAFTYATQPIPNMTILIVDTGSGRQLMNNAVPVTSIFGNAQHPFVMPISRVLKANATLQFTAVNFDAAVNTGNLRLSLHGWKQYYMPGNNQGVPGLPY
jgi:hypothetical protein